MELKLESTQLADYLKELPPVVEWHSPRMRERVEGIMSRASSDLRRAELAFEVARDQVAHSFDTGHEVVSITADDALRNGEGICFAKAHLLAALLRGMGIPCGFCYQRVLRKGTVESGHALHGLNAVYLEETGWFRVDPRGNKPGIDSRFSPQDEKLAYPIRPELGEVDYPDVRVAPLPAVLRAMQEARDCHTLFWTRPQAV